MVYKLIREGDYLFTEDKSAHLPLNGASIILGKDILPPYSRHQEDNLDKKSVDFIREIGGTEQQRLAFKDGYLGAREKYKYTDEDMRKAISHAYKQARPDTEYEPFPLFHQYPTEFETEDVLTPSQIFYPNDVPYSSPKTITTAQGVQWVGKYK